MRMSPQGATVVALLADPDAPTDIAQRMAETLPARLADKSGRQRRFTIEVISEPFTAAAEDPPTLMRRIMDRGRAENWDIVVALTDLPLHLHGRKLAVNLSHEHGLALLSLPSLGGLRLQTRARQAVEEAVLGLAGLPATGTEEAPRRLRLLGPFTRRPAPVHPGPADETDPSTSDTSPAGRVDICAYSWAWSAPTGRGGWCQACPKPWRPHSAREWSPLSTPPSGSWLRH